MSGRGRSKKRQAPSSPGPARPAKNPRHPSGAPKASTRRSPSLPSTSTPSTAGAGDDLVERLTATPGSVESLVDLIEQRLSERLQAKQEASADLHELATEPTEEDEELSDGQVEEALSEFLPEGAGDLGTEYASYDLYPSQHVSDKLKQAIWANKFVEFSALLPEQLSQPESVAVSVKTAGHTTIHVPNSKPAPRDLNIDQWVSAFTVFMDIYVQKFPQETRALLAYLNRIRSYARSSGQRAFNFYDRTFRQHRQSRPLRWVKSHAEIWQRMMEIAPPGSSSGVKSGQNAPQKGRPFKGVCHMFSAGGHAACTRRPCPFAHICAFCKKNHPVSRCFLKQKKEGLAADSHQSKGQPTPHSSKKSAPSSTVTSQSFRDKQ